MNRLLLAFGLVCILQCVLPYELPNIQFDTEPFDGNTLLAANDGNVTGQIKGMITAINVTETQAITNVSNGNVAGQIKDMITAINVTETQAITNISKLLAANDGYGTEELSAFITYLNEQIDVIVNIIMPNIVVMYADNYTGAADQLSDVFRHITLGMLVIRDKAVIIQEGMQAANNSEATVNEIILGQFLLRNSLDLQRATNNLQAYIPLCEYVKTIAKENLMEAKNYITELETLLYTGELTESGKYVDDIGRIANETIGQVIRDVTNENLKAYYIGYEIQFFKNIQDAPRYEDLVTVAIDLSVFFTTNKLLKQLKTMVAAFARISTSLTSRIAALQAGFNVLDFPLFRQLVYTLLGNDEYGRYCYVKYKVQSMDIFSNIFYSAWQCVDNEYARLEYLKTTLRLMIELLPFDHEDFLEQVKICDNHASGDNLNNCVAALANFYTNLFPQTANKISTILRFALDEAAASENRILICIELVYIQETIIEPQKISDNLAICNRDGPKGLD